MCIMMITHSVNVASVLTDLVVTSWRLVMLLASASWAEAAGVHRL